MFLAWRSVVAVVTASCVLVLAGCSSTSKGTVARDAGGSGAEAGAEAGADDGGSCGPTCGGCCDDAGVCQDGTEQATCGTRGRACVACVSPQICGGSGGATPGACLVDCDQCQLACICPSYCEPPATCTDAAAKD